MANIMFRQAKMERKIENGTMIMVSWIPEKYAVLKKALKLKNSNGEWENDWIVKEVSQSRVEEKELPDYHKDVKAHKRATGDIES